PGLAAFGYWPDRITPPAALVAWPDPYTYNATYQRGASSAEINVVVLVGRPNSRAAQEALADYAAGSGERSVRAAIESHTTTAWHDATVTTFTGGTVQVNGVDYLAGTFAVQIFGQGD